MLKKITPLALTVAASLAAFPQAPAAASFGDFMLGVGAGVGTSAIIRSRQDAARRYRPVSAEEEFARGRSDGINNARYDNPRNSADYTRGYEEGIRIRRGG